MNSTANGKHTIETIVPHYIGDMTTQREVLLTLRRVLMKYRVKPLTLPETSLTMESSTGEGGNENGRYNGK
jgi:hypothetical protein